MDGWWVVCLRYLSHLPSLPLSLSPFVYSPAMQKTLPQARSRGSQHRVFDCCRSFQDLVLVYLVLLLGILVRFLGLVQTPKHATEVDPLSRFEVSLSLSLSLVGVSVPFLTAASRCGIVVAGGVL
ncbi:hypothetical protein CABS01_01498 [Colletotrichum abscissum]|nr:uncharacterized protein CABS01_01498 [Colletotrichum abscissum]KAK1495691.1 hypothetical protein CABS01_01498 [Colletotrichum abscissum]